MRILIATPIYPPEIGGPATYTKELCQRLVPTHHVTVVAYTDVHTPFPGTTLISVSKQQPLLVRLFQYTVAVFRSARAMDVIIVQNAMAAGLPVALVHLLRRTPFVVKFVGDEAWERATQLRQTTKLLEEFLDHPDGSLRTRSMMAVQGFVLRHATRVMTPSQYLRDVLIRVYRVQSSHIVVNYNAAETPDVVPFPETRQPHQILVTARLTVWKGIQGVIDAVALLRDTFSDIRLVIAGDGPESATLQRHVATRGLAAHVVFLGNVSRAETWHIRKESAVYVLNSTYEGLPHTVLTSFAAEIPTIATNIPGTREVVIHQKTGLLVEPGDTHGLAQAIQSVFEHPEMGTALARSAHQFLQEKFSWGAHLRILGSILEAVCAKPGHETLNSLRN